MFVRRYDTPCCLVERSIATAFNISDTNGRGDAMVHLVAIVETYMPARSVSTVAIRRKLRDGTVVVGAFSIGRCSSFKEPNAGGASSGLFFPQPLHLSTSRRSKM